jgi:hypothetical protein
MSYDTELKMEMKLWKLRNISRWFCKEVVAPKGTEAHTLGTIGLCNTLYMFSNKRIIYKKFYCEMFRFIRTIFRQHIYDFTKIINISYIKES